MELTYFLTCIIATSVLSFVLTYFLYNPNKLPTQIRDLSNKCGISVIGAIFFGWTLVELASYPNEWPNTFSPFGVFPFLIAALALSLYSIEKCVINRFWIYLLITLISSQFFPEDVSVCQGLLPIELERLCLAIIWALFIHLYTTMDKVESMTLIQTQALCIGFTFLFPIYPNLFPINFAYYPILILAALLGFLFYKKSFPFLQLGKTGSAPLGFLMGFFFILMADKGMWLAFIVMPSYYYFEWIYSFIYRLKNKTVQLPIKYTFYISHVIQNHLNGVGIMSFLMKRMIILALLGILIQDFIIIAAVALVILYLDLITRLNTWGEPKPRLRDVFSDVKQATSILWHSAKDEVSKLKKR